MFDVNGYRLKCSCVLVSVCVIEFVGFVLYKRIYLNAYAERMLLNKLCGNSFDLLLNREVKCASFVFKKSFAKILI